MRFNSQLSSIHKKSIFFARNGDDNPSIPTDSDRTSANLVDHFRNQFKMALIQLKWKIDLKIVYQRTSM